jgi:hypothetical protein
VNVVQAGWNKDFFEELEIFNGDKKNKDDQVDAVSDCFSVLNKGFELPDFTLPDLSGSPSGIVMPSYSFTNTSFPSFPSFNL